jgi:simple sugar transport system permease protein
MTEQNSHNEEGQKKNAVAVFFSEVTKGTWLIPVLAIVTGLILGGLIVMFTTEEMYAAFGDGQVWEGLKIGFGAFADSFEALFKGSIGDPGRMIDAVGSGDQQEIRRAFNPFLESLVAATPYIFAGLAVAIAFRCSMFNIGAEGQLFIGAITATWVGYSVEGLPPVIHIPLALLAGAAGGALWGLIPGWLKAQTGAHEVINTIMMNYVAYRLSEYLLRGPMQRPNAYSPVSPFIQDSAKLFRFFKEPIRFHIGFFIALGVAWLVWWYLFRTKWGFELRTVGANPNAARYAGMNVPVTMVLAMALAGSMAGLAGANEVLGVNHFLGVAFSSGYGFDAIALALLGKSHPAGVVAAAILFGFLSNGAIKMQVMGIPVDIITIIQALVIIFVAAPAIVRTIYRLKEPEKEEEPIALASSLGGE